MLKWIGGCLVLIVVAVIGVMWFGYRKLQTFAAAGPSSITINAPASRVFANIADVDSMTEWRAEGLGIRAPRKGLLRVGDTLNVQMAGGGDAQRRRTLWIVTALTPDKLLALEMKHDSTGKIIASRRDSIVALGDSTRVVIVLAAPGLDSLRAQKADSGEGTTMLDMASQLLIAGMKAQSEFELKRLKARLEGDSVPPMPQSPRSP